MHRNVSHIYLADDDHDDQQLFALAFSEIFPSIEITTFDDGVTLIDRLLNQVKLPDLIFLDLNMPLMNGEECLRDIRSEMKLKKIPIIIYSASFEIHRIEELFAMGANRYLQKPRTFDALKSTLRRSIESIITKEKKKLIIPFADSSNPGHPILD